MSSRRKQEEKHLEVLKGIQQIQCNKKCFECDQRGPTYVDVTIGSMVCTTCGGILRGLNPPHRVKSISMATFTPTEIAFIQTRGNEYCKNIYLGRYDERSKAKPESRNDHTKLKFFMEQKYEQKKWYVSPEQAAKPTESFMEAANAAKANEIKPLTTLLGPNHANIKVEKKQPEKPKPQSPKQQQTIDSIFGDFSGGSTASSTTQPPTSGFADFSNAFTPSNNSFDAFGDFTSGQTTAAPASQPGFGTNFNSVMTAASTTSAPQATKSVDKYADLGDLFSMDNADPAPVAKPDAGNMWMQSQSASVFGQQSTASGSVFGSQANAAPLGSVFGAQSTASTQASLFGSSPMSNTQSYMNNKQPVPFSNATQSYTHFGTSQSTPAYGSVQQPNPGFPAQQQNTYNGTFGTAPGASYMQAASTYGATQPTNNFGAQQFSSMQGFGGTAQQNTFAATNSQMTFPTQTPAPSNPFFMQTPASAAPSATGANPFMAQQHQQAPTQPQTATNPFMNLPPQQVNAAPTNPFF
uniref:Zinc finger protein n=1 Tax=Ciona intestinalis TaxID=7719 RepID=Q1RQ00_CIOIN|nr:zinc finger protein [Ciona intestinalis]BAE93285.1 zinc finger protein [Ciona intestinalis]|eukprot:NP_001071901.1 zinc finger protein [Ciona intestinalis]